jgi:hypothetical protein
MHTIGVFALRLRGQTLNVFRRFDMSKKVSKNTICLWYDRDALDAATFYAKTFPDSSVGAIFHAPGDYPSGKQGNVLTVSSPSQAFPASG